MKLLNEMHFAISSGSFLFCFAAITILQLMWPHHRNMKADFKNWRVNLPLAICNSTIMGFISVRFLMPIFANDPIVFKNLKIWETVLLIVASVLILDLLSYFWHWANHRFAFMWRFHEVHHSDRNFDTSTAVRFHLIELLISFFVRLAVIKTLGLPFIGFLVYEVLFQFFNIFEHGNLTLRPSIENRMAKIFITPGLHRKHHSTVPSDLNSNFGTIFSFWDRLFHTFKQGSSSEHYQVGLPNSTRDWSFVEVLLRPFLNDKIKKI